MIYLFTGDGGGKTTNALGLALRCIGHEKKVLIIQFMKWWKNTGEMLFKNPNYQIFQFGRKGWHGFDNLNDYDKQLTELGLSFAFMKARLETPHLLVLDEINLAVHCKLIKVEDVLWELDRIPNEINVVLTGRHAPKTLKERADYVIEVVDVKHPKEFESVAGIQY